MRPYKNYTIRIALKSSLITPFQSDTIFGHICWALRFLKWDEGEDRLEIFLKEYDNDTSPPLLVSNGFPEGYLPKPVLPPVPQNEIDEIVGLKNRIEMSYRIKTLKKLEYIRKEDFIILLEKGLNSSNMLELLLNNYDSYRDIIELQPHDVQRNTVNRASNTVTRGLYSDREIFFTKGFDNYEIYVKTNFFSKNELERIFGFISIQGFGKNKSTGKGAFTFEINENERLDIPESSEPNAFMTLSSYIPKKNEPGKGYYQILHKYGKLAGSYKSEFPKISNNPFKAPLIMMSAGSVFIDSEFHDHKVYGSLLNDVHKNYPEVRQYSYAFPVGIKLGGNGEKY